MSAFIVNKQTIDGIVDYAEEHKLLGYGLPTDPVELGQILWKENHRSVNYRYKEKARTPKYYRSSKSKWIETPQFYKLLHCLNYQSCERDDWEKTKAYKYLRELGYRAGKGVVGYDDADWGF